MSAKRTATVIEARCDCCNTENRVVQIVAVPDDNRLSPRAVRLCFVCVGFAYGVAAHGIQESDASEVAAKLREAAGGCDE